MSRIHLMNIMIDNYSMQEALDFIVSTIKKREKIFVVTPNVDHIVKLEENVRFQEAYKNAGLVLVDGTPIMWIAKWYGTPLKEKITGPRLAEKVFELASQNGFSVFILGAADGVAETAAHKMSEKYDSCNIVGTYSPKYGFEKDEKEINRIIQIINRCKPDLLVAGMGSPKTEILLNEHIQELDVRVALSVGAAIDFISGNVERCSEWINKIGLEWLYRFIKEPKRMFKRYFIDDVKILNIALKYKKWRGRK